MDVNGGATVGLKRAGNPLKPWKINRSFLEKKEKVLHCSPKLEEKKNKQRIDLPMKSL